MAPGARKRTRQQLQLQQEKQRQGHERQQETKGEGMRVSKRAREDEAEVAETAASTATTMIGRTTELRVISDFLKSFVETGKGSSLYICGSTGTGKTASVSQCIKNLDGGKRKVVTAKLNGNSFGAPNAIFQALEKEFQGYQSVNPEAARLNLTAMFRATSNRGKLYLAVVDEIDQLLMSGSKEQILYQLFEWAAKEKSNFCLIGIANAIDLHERFLPNLKQHDCEPQMLVYSAYEKDELQAILSQRMTEEAAASGFTFDAMGLELCARKIAAKSGDLRKGLEICKRALLISRSKVNEDPTLQQKVSVSALAAVMRSVFESPYVEAIRSLPLQAQYALIAVARRERRKAVRAKAIGDGKGTGNRSMTVEEAFKEYHRMTSDWQLPAVSQGDFASSLLDQLAQDSLIMVGQAKLRAKSLRDKTVQLCPRLSDVKHALEDNPSLRDLVSGRENRRFGANLYKVA